ncbi:aspartate aminotransferase family protein [Streptosporangium sp. NBC_01755]|uniref:aspartate aminotransferase family protein n=1 Tax=unclassified Streptosporangium TaxID=2632669 RepID=UPI002DD94A13|nr:MULTISPECIES: aspartate aminotransferase family protein [unclassified Streptosporangium]WSA24153.1 aspartate aminotransferase family protein [Streptosporangium sp. NBC_01810]WSC97773.1 aspartate aminotransferase family protein [Streptosporangium sp. NBC_01755]
MEFDVSRAQIEHASAVVAGGVNSAFRLGIRPHPLVFASADGPILTDVDGNQLIDYFLGMGPMLLGHRPPAVVEAARAQLDRSILVAGQTELEYAAARLLVELVPSAELVRFSVSGSEAVQVALRVARAATGRSTVVKFEGHYHGWFDNVLWSVAPDLSEAGPREAPVPLPGSAGQIPDRNISVLPWNDTEALRDRLGSGDVAAVIMEPVMFNSAGIVPAPGYLEAVREACDAAGTVLVFDEVITGFRVAPGGAQQRFGVLPDLTVLGKALASGFPVAALVGRRRYMNLVADRQVLHGGTYNTQSIAMAATLATLTQIRDGAPYRRIDQVGTRLMAGLREEFAAAGVDARIVGYPAVFHVRFGTVHPRDYREAQQADTARYADFAAALLRHGVRVLPRGTWFVSAAHEDSHVDATLAAVRAVLAGARPEGNVS